MPGMNDRLTNDRFTEAMKRLATEAAQSKPPLAIEANLLAEFDRVNRQRKRLRWTISAVALAASIAIALFVEYRPSQPIPAVSPDAPVAEESEQPFIPIPYVTPLGLYERAEVVRMELPVAALIAAGLPVRTADPGARAQADVVVGQDGRARAVRLISISKLN